MKRSIPSTTTALCLLGLAVSACAPTVVTRGNMVDPETVSVIKPGVSRDQDVVAFLGTPTSVGTFDQKVWYYIGQRTEKVAFFEPEVTDRQVVVVHFDDAGVVTDLKTIDESQGQQIEVVDRTTPTAGRELGFLEQVLGNVGRFSSKENSGPVGPSSGRIGR